MHGACFGPCPSYRVTLDNEFIEFEGFSHTAALGKHHMKMDRTAFLKLAQKFVDNRFFSMKDSYRDEVSDSSVRELTITIDGQTKTVVDYIGHNVGMPHIIEELEDDVNNLAQTEMWIHGSPELMGHLKEENFDFHSPEAEQMLESFINKGDLDDTKQMFESGTNANVMFRNAEEYIVDVPEKSILEVASEHPELLKYLIERKVCADNQEIKNHALFVAKVNKNLEAAILLMDYGAK
jgi:hypothetical protein